MQSPKQKHVKSEVQWPTLSVQNIDSSLDKKKHKELADKNSFENSTMTFNKADDHQTSREAAPNI